MDLHLRAPDELLHMLSFYDNLKAVDRWLLRSKV